MEKKSRSARAAERKRAWSARKEEYEAQRERAIARFEAAVHSSFSFLENDYGFERRAAERRDFEYARDAYVVVPYYGTCVALEVSFGLADSRIGAVICELEGGRMPERVSLYGNAGYARAISVDSFISMVSGGTVLPVLPEASPRKPRIGIFHAAEMRVAALRTNMEGVVAQIAERVKTWCAPMLKGDTSAFPAVQEFHRQKYWPESSKS